MFLLTLMLISEVNVGQKSNKQKQLLTEHTLLFPFHSGISFLRAFNPQTLEGFQQA